MEFGITSILILVCFVGHPYLTWATSSDTNTSWEGTNNDLSAMVSTNMVITCPPGRNCTSIRTTPGANVASPISMFLTGTIGNAVALLVLHRNSRREQMRTVFYLLVGCLVWTDVMGIVLTSIPVLVVYLNGRWVGSTGLCNYHAFTMIAVGLITPCIVCIMAVERFLGIRHGYFYKKHVNRSRVRMVLLTQWIVVLIFTSLPFFGFGQYSRQYPGTWCFFDLHATELVHQAYAFTFAIFIIFLILIIIFCNIAVIATLIGMRHRRKHLNSPSRERQVHRSQRQREIEIQMVILLVGITLLFTTCWMPLMVQIILNQIIDYNNDFRRDLLAIRLVSINQTFDPWIYILFRKVIFTKFWHFLRRCTNGKSSKTSMDSKRTVPNIGEENDHQGAPPFNLPLPPPDGDGGGDVGLNSSNDYCLKCESQYGDVIQLTSKGTDEGDPLEGEDGPLSSAWDGDSALEAEDYEEDLSSSVGDIYVKSNSAALVSRCKNCHQLITTDVNGPLENGLLKGYFKMRPQQPSSTETNFFRKYSKRSLPIATELPMKDNCRTVHSAII